MLHEHALVLRSSFGSVHRLEVRGKDDIESRSTTVRRRLADETSPSSVAESTRGSAQEDGIVVVHDDSLNTLVGT